MLRSCFLLAFAAPLAFSLGCSDPDNGKDNEDVEGSRFVVDSPAGAQGQQLDVVVEADISVFDFANTDMDFGDGITVNSVTVADGWTAVADVTIDADAEVGQRDVTMDIDGFVTTLEKTFRVTDETFSLVPEVAKIGETLEIQVEGRNTKWESGRSWINFGDGVDVLDFTVLSETLATANISVDQDAAPGLRDVFTEDGQKVVTLYDGFQIDRVALAATFDPTEAEQGTQVEFTIVGRGTNFTQDVTEITFYDGGSLNPDVRVDDITVLDAENMWGRMTLSNGAELGLRDVAITTDTEGVRIPDAFEVIGGEWSLDEVAIDLTFNVVRGIDNETGGLTERVTATCIFYIPLDPQCPSGGGSGSKPEPAPYDDNVVGPIIGSGSGGDEDCPNPTTISAGDYVWLESEINTVTLEKYEDANSGMIYYVGNDLTIDDYVPDNLYDLHLQGDPDGLAEELLDGVLPTVPCNWYMETPELWGNYTHDRSTDFDYTWTNTLGGYGACTYPDAIFYTEISGTNYIDTDYPGMAASIPWDDGDHTYTADELSQLEPGQAYFIGYSYIEGREFGLRDSIYQTNVADSYIYLQASMILE